MSPPATRQQAGQPNFSEKEFRASLAMFATGVTIITARTPAGALVGLTANSFNSLSLDPPLVLWSIVRKSASLPGFLASGHFAINVLASDQSDLSHRFATPSDDKFAALDLQEGLGGSPLLPGALASFECQIQSTIEGGDHLLFVGRVHKIRYRTGEPLIFNGGKYCTALPLRTGSAESDLNAVWGGLG